MEIKYSKKTIKVNINDIFCHDGWKMTHNSSKIDLCPCPALLAARDNKYGNKKKILWYNFLKNALSP